MHIITHAYGTDGNPAAPAFYPLMPLVVSVVHFISFGLIPYALGSLLVNTVALWAALYFLVKILQEYTLSRFAQSIGVLALLVFPSAFFMHVFYSEALFIAIGLAAYYFALIKKWWMVGVLLAILTATRLPALLFVLLCGLEYLNAYKWNIRKALNKNLLWFLLAPLGLTAYSLYLLIVRGDALAMFHAYSATNDWAYQQFNLNIFSTLYQPVKTTLQSLSSGSFNYEIFINNVLPLGAIVLVIWASVYCLGIYKKRGIPLAIFGLVSIVLFTLNSNIVSVHRYALACLVIYIAVASLVHRQKRWVWLLVPAAVISLGLQLFLYTKFINDIFAG